MRMTASTGNYQLFVGRNIFKCIYQIMQPLFWNNSCKEQNIFIFLQSVFLFNAVYLFMFRAYNTIRNIAGFPSVFFLEIIFHVLRQNNQFVRMLCRHFFSESQYLRCKITPFRSLPVQSVYGCHNSHTK